MKCPFCNGASVDYPTVDIGVGEVQCGPAECNDCMAWQDGEGKWHDGAERRAQEEERGSHG